MRHSEEFRSISRSPEKPSPAPTLLSSVIATILTNSTLIRFQKKIKNEIIYGGGGLPVSDFTSGTAPKYRSF